VPIELPIRERWLIVGCFFAFEDGGVLSLLELPIREAPLERAAGCSALLGTDGLVVSILLPIRELMLGLTLLLVLIWLFGLTLLLVLIRLFVLVAGLFVVVVRERLLDGVLVLIELPIRDDMLGLIRLLEFVLSEVEVLSTGRLTVLRVLVAGLFVIVVCERLLEGVLVLSKSRERRLVAASLRLIELPIRDVMLGLIRLLVLGAVGRELIDRLEVLLLGARLVMALLEMLLLGARLVIDLLEMLLLGARLVIDLLEVLLLGVRLVIDLLDVLLLGVRLVIDLLDVLLLGVRLVMDLLDVLLLGVRLVMDLLEVLLLGVRLAVTLLELRLDATLLELFEELGLDVALGAGAGFEACRVCLLELLDLLLLDRFVAAKTGSQNNKRANRMQVTRKSDLLRRACPVLTFNF